MFEVQAEKITVYAYGANGLISSYSGGEVSYYHLDNMGSVALITSVDEELKYYSDYYPFGARIHNTDSEVSRSYLANIEDKDTGLSYFYNRYYDPSLGKFISVDPIIGNIANPQRLNKYAYSLNNPLRYSDANGLDPSEHIPYYVPGCEVDCGVFGAKIRWDGAGNTLLGPEIPGLNDAENTVTELWVGPKGMRGVFEFSYQNLAVLVTDTLWLSDSTLTLSNYVEHDPNVGFKLGFLRNGFFNGLAYRSDDGFFIKSSFKNNVASLSAETTKGGNTEMGYGGMSIIMTPDKEEFLKTKIKTPIGDFYFPVLTRSEIYSGSSMASNVNPYTFYPDATYVDLSANIPVSRSNILVREVYLTLPTD